MLRMIPTHAGYSSTAHLAWEALANVPFVVWSWLCFSAVSQQFRRIWAEISIWILKEVSYKFQILLLWGCQLLIINLLEQDSSRGCLNFSVARWTLGFKYLESLGNWPSWNDGRLGNKIDIPTAASEDELRNALGCAEGGRSRIRMKLPSGLLTNEMGVSRNLWFVMHAQSLKIFKLCYWIQNFFAQSLSWEDNM